MPCPQDFPRPRAAGSCRCTASYRPVMSVGDSNSGAVSAVVSAYDAGLEVDRSAVREAVRDLLTQLRQQAPGRSVEVRVPPYGAIQCIAGPTHTRGTPPNVVEAEPVAFVLLATGRLTWAEAVGDGRVTASGIRADLSPYLPIRDFPPRHDSPPQTS